jgi:hypothetical protein
MTCWAVKFMKNTNADCVCRQKVSVGGIDLFYINVSSHVRFLWGYFCKKSLKATGLGENYEDLRIELLAFNDLFRNGCFRYLSHLPGSNRGPTLSSE